MVLGCRFAFSSKPSGTFSLDCFTSMFAHYAQWVSNNSGKLPIVISPILRVNHCVGGFLQSARQGSAVGRLPVASYDWPALRPDRPPCLLCLPPFRYWFCGFSVCLPPHRVSVPDCAGRHTEK